MAFALITRRALKLTVTAYADGRYWTFDCDSEGEAYALIEEFVRQMKEAARSEAQQP